MERLTLLEPTMAAPATIEAPQLDTGSESQAGHGWIVTVFDNDKNTYDEVIAILMVATGCSFEEACIEAWEIDHLGRSVVFHGLEKECRRTGEIIGKIGIKIEVSQE